jgi:transcription initiation factor IIE alpha subunit
MPYKQSEEWSPTDLWCPNCQIWCDYEETFFGRLFETSTCDECGGELEEKDMDPTVEGFDDKELDISYKLNDEEQEFNDELNNRDDEDEDDEGDEGDEGDEY